MEVIKVVCGVIWNDNKLFIARRKPEKSLGGYWEFPGGKIEEGEEPEVALKRELKEELGMEVEVLNFIGSNIHHYDKVSIDLIAFECRYIFKESVMIDHDSCSFVAIEELNNYKIAPADLFIIETLINK